MGFGMNDICIFFLIWGLTGFFCFCVCGIPRASWKARRVRAEQSTEQLEYRGKFSVEVATVQKIRVYDEYFHFILPVLLVIAMRD